MGLIPIKLARKSFPARDESRTKELAAILRRGVATWNDWRAQHPDELVDLRGMSFIGPETDLRGVNLREANLQNAHFSQARLDGADLSAVYGPDSWFEGSRLCNAKLQGSYLVDARLNHADLTGADLRLVAFSYSVLAMAKLDHTNCRRSTFDCAQCNEASFVGAILGEADFREANLLGANLSGSNLSDGSLVGANLVEANLEGATLDGCRVYGVSVWKARLSNAIQRNLIITPEDEPTITLDNLKVAQFVYLILNNADIREVIDTVTSKAVLILGRFSSARKPTLDRIRDALRGHNYVPMMFDFERPAGKSFIETVKTLASMARFVIADVTDAKVVLQELESIVKDLPSVPVQPILLTGAESSVVLLDFMAYDWFLPVYLYQNEQTLLESLKDKVLSPAEAKLKEIAERRERAVMQLNRILGHQ